MTKKVRIEVIDERNDIFVAVDGVKIAKRGRGRKARTWVSLRPGWRVIDSGTPADEDYGFFIEYEGVRL